MRNEGGELHSETDEARAGSTPHIVRWILGISLFAAIVLLSAVWIFGALSQGDVEEEITASSIAKEKSEAADIDGVLIDGADDMDAGNDLDPLNIPNETPEDLGAESEAEVTE